MAGFFCPICLTDHCEHGAQTLDATLGVKCLNPSCKNCKGEGTFEGDLCGPCHRLTVDSGAKFLDVLEEIAREDAVTYALALEPNSCRMLIDIAKEDAAGLKKAYESYGPSWKSRGGVGAFMMLARKWDRLNNRLKGLRQMWDIFYGIAFDDRGEGVIDDVRDLRRYLLLVEAEMRQRGFRRSHRDN